VTWRNTQGNGQGKTESAMIDFASALYLGLQHPAAQLDDYAALTTGTPASLAAAPLANRLAAQAAALQGCEAGLVAPSTLHLAIDVFDRLARTHALVADEALYPVMRWGLERAVGLGVPVAWFRHGDLSDLAQRLTKRRSARPPAVMTDATRIEGGIVPIGRYLKLVSRHGGLIVVDHSQMLGLMGERPAMRHPWGHGGGGAVRYAGLAPAQPVLLFASWAKAFGAPLATLCGPDALVREIARDGPTQSHCSAASQVALLAGLNALEINRREGAQLRAGLLLLLRHLHAGLRWLVRNCLSDLQVSRRDHPLQQMHLDTTERTLALHAGLRSSGFRTALLRQHQGRYALAIVIRANHCVADIDALLSAMAALAVRLPGTGHVTASRSSMEERQHV
jgi:8-amino-7-oxononanoate synthase